MKNEEFLNLKFVIQKKGFLYATIESDSMLPLIKVGDSIKISELRKNLVLGDILVFFQSGKLVCHAFLREEINLSNNHKQYITRGLNTSFLDFPVEEDLVLGIVQEIKLNFWQKAKLYLASFA